MISDRWLIWIVGIGIVFLMIYLSNRQKKAKSDERALRASKLGWRYEPGDILARHVHFYGKTKSGLSWKLSYGQDGIRTTSSEIESPICRIVWTTKIPDAMPFLIRCKKDFTFEHTQSPILTLIRSGLDPTNNALVLGSARYSLKFYEDARNQAVGSAKFQERFKVFAPDSTFVKSLIGSQTEALLLDWPEAELDNFEPLKNFSATLMNDELRIDCSECSDGADMALFEHIVLIGESLTCKPELSVR